MISRFVVIGLIWFIIDFYFFQGIRTITDKKIWYWIYWLYDIGLAAIAIYFAYTLSPAQNTHILYYLFGFMLISLMPKLIASPILLLDDVVRLFQLMYQGVQKLISSKHTIHIPERRKFISQLALGVASIPFVALIYGMIRGRYNYQLRTITLTFADLPKAFHGFTITQLSDIHSGSFDNHKAVERGVRMVRDQASDLFLFTGDLINNRADEMNSWKKLFSTIRAPFGQFSVLGNHDYGDYGRWESAAEKKNNFEQLVHTHHEIGFNLLRNEAVEIEKDGEKISLIGVENWGKGGFHKYGDLDKAMTHVSPDAFKILMSHDPSHWDAKVLPHPSPVHLTLSGHTHGMQFGVEIENFKWSPSKYLYPQWAGIYNHANQFLYVNRGFGFLGYPGRVGILPEITVIKLMRG